MRPSGVKIGDSFGLCAWVWTLVWTRVYVEEKRTVLYAEEVRAYVYAEEVRARTYSRGDTRTPSANGSCGFWSGHFYTRIEVEKTILPLAAE
jgi:hypothetical protein